MLASPPSLLRLLSWLSPAFPTGAFSYSHGLEAAVDKGIVSHAPALLDWTGTVTRHGTGRSDTILLAQAYRAERLEALCEVARLAAALRPTAELAEESRVQGQAFMATAEAAWPAPSLGVRRAALRAAEIELTHPVAVALVARAHGVALDDIALGYLHSFAANIVSAGVRLIPLGQTEGQQVMQQLEADIVEGARAALDASLEDVGSATPMVDCLSMQHETQRARLFRS